MLLALLLFAGLADCVPARWPSGDPTSLELLKDTPVNCVLVEEGAWTPKFVAAAQGSGVRVLGVIGEGADARAAAARAKSAGLAGLVLAGSFSREVVSAVDAELPVIALQGRADLRLEAGRAGVIGTTQGAWPGIRMEAEGSASAGPTGGPWVNTNSGFLRFVRAASGAAVWMANRPPEGEVLRVERYLMAVADAAVAGGRWVVSLDSDFSKRLLTREARAVSDWRRLMEHVRFFEQNREWADLPPAGALAVLQDAESGALISGGLLDMIGARHTPARPVATRQLSRDRLAGTRVLVNIEPGSVPEGARAVLAEYEAAGNVVIAPPEGFRFPAMADYQLSLDRLSKEDHDRLDGVWKRVTATIGRSNLGARVFNAPGMLSRLLGEAAVGRRVLYLVNYTDYQAESITVWLPERFRKARLHLPGGEVRELDPYRVEEGWGVDIEVVRAVAVLEVE
jgi:hypothetical protein